MAARDPRIAEIEADLDALFAQVIALRATIVTLAHLLREASPHLPEALSRNLMDVLAPHVRSDGTPEAERQAAALERIAEQVLTFALPRPAAPPPGPSAD